MLIVRDFKMTYRLKEPNSLSCTYVLLQGKRTISVTMLIVRRFKITYKLKEPNSVSST